LFIVVFGVTFFGQRHADFVFSESIIAMYHKTQQWPTSLALKLRLDMPAFIWNKMIPHKASWT